MLGRFLKVVHNLEEAQQIGHADVNRFDTLIEIIQGPNKENIEVLLSYLLQSHRVLQRSHRNFQLWDDNNQAILMSSETSRAWQTKISSSCRWKDLKCSLPCLKAATSAMKLKKLVGTSTLKPQCYQKEDALAVYHILDHLKILQIKGFKNEASITRCLASTAC